MNNWLKRARRHEVFSATVRVLGWSGLAVLTNGVSAVLAARLLAVEDKGILTLVLSVGGLLFVLTSLGTNTAMRVEFPKTPSGVKMPDYLRVSIKLLSFHALATIGLIWIAAQYIGDLPSTPLFVALVVLLSLLVFTSSQALDALHAFSRSPTATRSDAIGALLTTLLLLIVLSVPTSSQELIWIVACYSAGYGARTALSFKQLLSLHRNTAPPSEYAHPRAECAQLRLVRVGYSFLGYNVGQTVAFRIDRYLLGVAANPRALGLYSVAATPAEMLRLPVTAFSQIMMQRTAVGGVSHRLVVQSCLVTLAITLPPAAILFLFANPIISVLFGSRYSGAGAVLQVMVLAEMVVAFFLVLSRIGAAAGLGRAIGIAAACGAVSDVAFLLALAPSYGAIGAAWASFVGNLVMTAICSGALLRRTKPPVATARGPG